MVINKDFLVKQIIQEMEAKVASIQENIRKETSAVISAPSARESWSDTTRSQKSGLIAGLQRQFHRTNQDLIALKQIRIEKKEKICPGALVRLEEAGQGFIWLIVHGVITTFEVGDNIVISTISPASLVARALYDHIAGDMVAIEMPTGIRNLKILEVQ